MSTFIVVGWKSLNAQPECLYIGSDGMAAQQAGINARESGAYYRLGKLVNPTMIPLPPVPFPKTEASVAVQDSATAVNAPKTNKKSR